MTGSSPNTDCETEKMAEQQGWLDGSIKNKSASFYSKPAGLSMLMHRNNVRFCEAIKPTTGGRRQRRQPSDIYIYIYIHI